MKLSIIILNFNNREIISKSLNLLKDIKKQVSSEVVVVDNASCDKSVEMMKNNFPEIKLIENKENIGFSAGNNLAVKKAKGRYLLFINGDVLVSPENILLLLKFLRKNKKIGVVTPKLKLRDGRMDSDCHRGFPTPWGAFCYFSGLEKIFPRNRLFSQYHQFYLNLDKPHQIDACCGAFMLVRREVGDRIGWWDENYFFYGEDIDFCYRAKEKGWQIFYYPKAKAIHYKGASSGLREETKDIKINRQTRIKAAKESIRAMRIFYNKFYKNKYPRWLTKLVLFGITLKGFIRIIINFFK